MLKTIIDQLCSQAHGVAFAVEFWDGDRKKYGSGDEAFVMRIADKNLFADGFDHPTLRLGEAYMDGRIDVRGDLRPLVGMIFSAPLDRFQSGTSPVAPAEIQSPEISRRNIAHHYDRGNDFFGLWLGRTGAYSCAYFKSHQDDLDTAQENKFDHICRKLQISRGMSLLDLGCGWGGFAIHAAKRYDARVVGITLSKEQLVGARERVAAAGVAGQVDIELLDYRELPAGRCFDRISSIGMLEHVGEAQLGVYAQETVRLLAPGGIGVIQTMGRVVKAPHFAWIEKHIFPGTYLPGLEEITASLGGAGLHVTDVENLRLHYAMTVDRWIEGYEKVSENVRERYGERFLRMWRMYLYSLAAAFRYGKMILWQLTFTRGPMNDLPLTRAHLYPGGR